MKIIDLLNDIENDEIEDGTVFEVIGDFFYKLIVIEKNLYCINEMTKKLEILDSKCIGRFDNRQYEIVELSNKINDTVEILEEEKKIPEKLKWNEKSQHNVVTDNTKKTLEHLLSRSEQLKKSINQIVDYLDYLKSKGE